MRNIGGRRYAAAAMLAVTLAGPAAAETVKVGLILPYSGPFAGLGAVMDNAIKLLWRRTATRPARTRSRSSAATKPAPTPTSPSALPRS